MESPRPVWNIRGMAESMIDRIDQRLKALDLSETAAAKAAGLSESYIRDMRRKNVNPTYKNVVKLAKVLQCSPDFLLEGAEEKKTAHYRMTPTPIVGLVKAGAWKDISVESQSTDYETIDAPHNERFPNARQYALKVEGDSMNEVVPDGHFAICVDFAETGLAPEHGMIVHVEQRIAGTHIIETTLKEIERKNGKYRLIPRSTNRSHKPLEIDGNDKAEVIIRGLAVGTWNPLF